MISASWEPLRFELPPPGEPAAPWHRLLSSDRSIREYCDDIWGVETVPVRVPVD